MGWCVTDALVVLRSVKKGAKFGGRRIDVESVASSSRALGSGGASSLVGLGMGDGTRCGGRSDCREGGDDSGRKDMALRGGGGYIMEDVDQERVRF